MGRDSSMRKPKTIKMSPLEKMCRKGEVVGYCVRLPCASRSIWPLSSLSEVFLQLGNGLLLAWFMLSPSIDIKFNPDATSSTIYRSQRKKKKNRAGSSGPCPVVAEIFFIDAEIYYAWCLTIKRILHQHPLFIFSTSFEYVPNVELSPNGFIYTVHIYIFLLPVHQCTSKAAWRKCQSVLIAFPKGISEWFRSNLSHLLLLHTSKWMAVKERRDHTLWIENGKGSVIDWRRWIKIVS